MIRRATLLLGMLSFGLAWIVGVWCGHSPLVRLESALLALAAGATGGACIAIALQKIVLSRLAEQWREVEAGEEARRTATKGNTAQELRARARAATEAAAGSAPKSKQAMAEAAR